jgi:hypothetical protein
MRSWTDGSTEPLARMIRSPASIINRDPLLADARVYFDCPVNKYKSESGRVAARKQPTGMEDALEPWG